MVHVIARHVSINSYNFTLHIISTEISTPNITNNTEPSIHILLSAQLSPSGGFLFALPRLDEFNSFIQLHGTSKFLR